MIFVSMFSRVLRRIKAAGFFFDRDLRQTNVTEIFSGCYNSFCYPGICETRSDLIDRKRYDDCSSSLLRIRRAPSSTLRLKSSRGSDDDVE